MQIDTNKFQMFSNIMRWCKRKQNIYEMKQCLMVHYISLKNDRSKLKTKSIPNKHILNFEKEMLQTV